jgi:hypothetical protein
MLNFTFCFLKQLQKSQSVIGPYLYWKSVPAMPSTGGLTYVWLWMLLQSLYVIILLSAGFESNSRSTKILIAWSISMDINANPSLCYDGFVIAVFFTRLIDIKSCNLFDWAFHQTCPSPTHPPILPNKQIL